jgi:hypothetical protein
MWTRQIIGTWRLPALISEITFVLISHKEMCCPYGGLQDAET